MLNFRRKIGLIVHVLVLLTLGVACTSSSSVPLESPAPQPPPKMPDNPNEKPGQPTPSPSPTPNPGTPQKVARIYCLDQPTRNSMLNTLRADVIEGYSMPGIRFFSDKGGRALDLKNPVPLVSDGRDSSLILKAQVGSMVEPWGIYRGKVDLLNQDGTLSLLSSYSEEPNQFAYNQLKMPIKLIDANQSRNAIVYPNDSGTYVLHDLKKSSRSLLPLSAKSASNPRFIRDSWIAFDYPANNSTLTQKFYSLKSGKITSIPESSNNSYQLFGFVNSQGNYFWIEGKPGETWTLKGMSSSGRISSVTTLPGDSKNIYHPFVFFERGQGSYLAYIEENIDVNNRGQFYVKTGLVHVIRISSDLKLADRRKIEYSDAMKAMIQINKTQTPTPKLLRNLFFEPISQQLFASIVVQGGLASYDFTTNSWGAHASFFSGCLTPGWGLENLND